MRGSRSNDDGNGWTDVKKNISILLLLAALSGPSFAGNFLFGGKSEKDSAFETAVAKKKNLISSILATGTVRPIIGAEVKVGARISGKVERLHANIGDRVEKDQVIAEIEQKDLEAQVARSQSQSGGSRYRSIPGFFMASTKR